MKHAGQFSTHFYQSLDRPRAGVKSRQYLSLLGINKHQMNKESGGADDITPLCE